MPTATPTLERTVAFVRSDESGNFTRADDGSATLTDLKVFRSGTFRDSMGEQRTWTAEHLAQIVSNFEMLRDAGTFVDVPVRRDHNRSVDNVVGYLRDLHTDGAYLYGTIEFTEPDAADKWERGTFRARSLEVGAYRDNDESTFFPVAMGLAFVDVGAVEGLHSAAGDESPAAIDDTEETKVDKEQFEQACAYAQWVTDAEYAQWEIDASYAQAVADLDYTVAAAYAQGLEEGRRTAAAEHAQGDKAPMVFSLFGEQTNDVNETQRHITALEGAVAEHAKSARTDFVDGLVADHRIAAPQRDQLLELALGLDEEQYATFTKTYEGAPAAPTFARFDGVTNPDGDVTDKEDEISVLEDQVAMHRRMGMTDDKIAELDSAKRLKALRGEQD